MINQFIKPFPVFLITMQIGMEIYTQLEAVHLENLNHLKEKLDIVKEEEPKVEIPMNEEQKIEIEEPKEIETNEPEIREEAMKEIPEIDESRNETEKDDIERERDEIMKKIKEAAEGKIVKQAELKVIPYKEESIAVKNKSRHKRREPRAHKSIESVDNLDRLKRKIRERRNNWAFRGVAIE